MNRGNQLPGGSFSPRLTPAVKNLLIVMGAVFLLQLSFAQFGGIALEAIFGFAPLRFFSGQIWQLVTYPFLHGSLSHILFNALILYMLGSELESRWGTRRFLKYFSVCAIGGALLQSLCWGIALLFFPRYADFLGNIPIIGASGGLFGLFMAFGYLYAESYVLVFFVVPMRAKHFVTFLAAIEIISAVFYSEPGSGGGVAHLVHLGGLFTGFLYLKIKGDNLDGRGGGLFRKKKMDRDEIRRRLSLVVNNEPKVGNKNYPITWN